MARFGGWYPALWAEAKCGSRIAVPIRLGVLDPIVSADPKLERPRPPLDRHRPPQSERCDHVSRWPQSPRQFQLNAHRLADPEFCSCPIPPKSYWPVHENRPERGLSPVPSAHPSALYDDIPDRWPVRVSGYVARHRRHDESAVPATCWLCVRPAYPNPNVARRSHRRHQSVHIAA